MLFWTLGPVVGRRNLAASPNSVRLQLEDMDTDPLDGDFK